MTNRQIALLERLGYREVRTLLNSGNVVFTVPAGVKGDPAARIEQALDSELGVTARVTVLTAQELNQIIEQNPLLAVADNPSRLLGAVLSQAADGARLQPLLQQDWAPDALALGDRVAYMWCADGVLASALSQAVRPALGAAATARNWSALRNLKSFW